ncbi:MAG: aryl-sulfate sulfotransferase [Flavobacteriales bacterium]|tara:strand:+ start:11891 stop:13189 length:1299 start_codon:yes stop_codon:yes gene_type:complete
MKIKFYSIILILGLYNCNNEAPDAPFIPPVVELTENIEVYNPDLISNDYILAVENSSTTSYLLNKEGNKIYTWNFSDTSGNDIELLPDGSIIGLFKDNNPTIDFGGFGGTAKIIDNNNNTIWEYTVSNNNSIAHHDVEILPNGNVLMIIWERVLNQIAIENGVDFENDIFVEKIIEINRASNTIVWEWNSWNHIIQDKFENLPNYGNINNNPNKININYSVENPPGGNFFSSGDIMHANGLDYDENNDLIYLSVNYYDEVWVIDHSTTTNEAISSQGGNFNKGGDLVYRFGNPNTYNSLGDKIFDKQHFPNLLENGVVGEGNILIYANGVSNQQSYIYELQMPTSLQLLSNSNNEPDIVWSFTNEDLFANKLSGAVRLSNGNTLITESDYGLWEVTNEGEVVWKYKKDEEASFIWRSYHYEPDSDAISNLGF